MLSKLILHLRRMSQMKSLVSLILVVVFFLQINNASAELYELPFMFRGDDPEHQGFMRIINLSPLSASVSVFGVTDSGIITAGLASFSVPADGAVHFKISDLENGNIAKGLTDSIGVSSPSDGDWRIYFISSSSLKVLGYYRNTATGFLTPIHDTSYPAFSGSVHVLYTANPGSNLNQLSKLRLMNNSDLPATAILIGRDDDGIVVSPEPAIVNLSPFQAVTLTMAELEQGSSNSILSGSFGDGTGKWQITVLTAGEPISVMSLLYAPNGYFSNMSSSGYDITSNGGRFPISCETIDGAGIFADDGSRNLYLGFLGLASAEDSIYNTAGVYGSSTSSTSVNNPSSEYGSSSGNFSSNNPTAPRPPLIVKHGRIIGLLTTVTGIPGALTPTDVAGCTFTSPTKKETYNPNEFGVEPSETF